VLACVGDLVEDVVVRLDGPIDVATDTPARIVRRRGGSAANTAAVAVRLGARARFLGQVGDDAIGTALLAELATVDGVDVARVRRGGATGTVVALVDAAGERSMLTDRGACLELSDPEPEWLDGVTALHVPFYSLADGPIAATATTLIGWAHERGVAVSIDVSSTAVMRGVGLDEVQRRLHSLHPALLLANDDEARFLAIDGAVAGAITIVKRGPDPATVHVPGERSVDVAAIELTHPVDTTGAGDAFTAGVLTSAAWRSDPVAACARGHRAAVELLRSR
jgi:sugar/nucleoside kinase (ribokinase family)